MTLLELLVVPFRENNKRLAIKYRTLLNDLLSEPLIPLDETIAGTLEWELWGRIGA